MPKKGKPDHPGDSPLADAARISPQQIWQAGLGAFLKAQEEGDRAFVRLVSEGSARQRARAQDGELPSSWHALEQMFEDRVARALAAMAVPTHHDLDELRAQVEALPQTVETLTREAARRGAVKTGAAKTGAAKTGAAKTSAAKKTVAKKTVAKTTGRTPKREST
ncbi:MAG: phasin family protein [Gammaproteobacteria bacterium]